VRNAASAPAVAIYDLIALHPVGRSDKDDPFQLVTPHEPSKGHFKFADQVGSLSHLEKINFRLQYAIFPML
jgi:hypothetical protein